MKLLTWNIRQGGGKRLMAIRERIEAHSPDVIVLTEFRTSSSQALARDLCCRGWSHQVSTSPPPRVNGLLIASRSPLVQRPQHPSAPTADFRWVEVELVGANLCIAGVYIPDFRGSAGDLKAPYWQSLLNMAKLRSQERQVFLGDFNTGKHYRDEAGATFQCDQCMDELEGLGWVDAWRAIHKDATEFTWYSNRNNGFRLDHAFLSPSMAPSLANAMYSHREREDKVSDHSPLVIELT